MIQLAFGRVDGFLVHSDKLITEVEKFRPGALIERIYHPLYDFYSQWDVEAEASDDVPKRNLLFFGKIREYKGLEIFLKALPLIDEGIDFEAVVAGEFYVDPQPFKQLVEDSGLADRVIWMDRYIENEAVPELFRKADLVVLPYLSATQSGVVPLAYQFDVPVIASDVGGLSEVVLDGKTGYLTPVGDFRYLAGRIDEYFLGEKGKEFRENIRHFKQRLSWPQVIDSILSLLNHETRRRSDRLLDERID
jgi:glycosyltransferase involved in cell wall biosynthesis